MIGASTRATTRSIGRRHSSGGGAGPGGDGVNLSIGLLLILFGVTVVVWACGQLAARLFDGGWPHATVSEIRLFHLLRHPGDPGGAWPAAAGHHPGPVAFWAVMAAAALLASTLTWQALDRYHRGEARRRPGQRSAWATSANLAALYVPDPKRHAPASPGSPGSRLRRWLPTRLRPLQANRLILGRVRRRLVAVEGVQGVCVFGPTRSQKTVGFVITTLLERLVGPVVTTSVKPDVLRATVQFRRRLGRVWVYDPKESTGEPTAHWSPLAACLTYEGAKEMAETLVKAAQLEPGGKDQGKFWNTKSRELLAPLLFAAAHSTGRILTVINWLRLNKKTPVLRALDHIGGPAAKEAINEFLGGYNSEPRLKSNIVASCLGVLEVYTSPSVAQSAQVDRLRPSPQAAAEQQGARRKRLAALQREQAAMRQSAEQTSIDTVTQDEWQAIYERSQQLQAEIDDLAQEIDEEESAADSPYDLALDFDPKAFLDGHNTLYLCAPEDQQEQLAPLFQALIMEIYREARSRAHRHPTGRLELPLLLLLDETGNAAPLADLDKIASTGVGRNIQLVTVWHNLGQMYHRYGRDVAMTIANNLWAKVVLAGVSCIDTAEYFANLIGREEVARWGITRQADGGRSASESIQERQLSPPESIRQITPGSGILIYRDLPPAVLRLRPWYDDRGLVDRVDPAFALQEFQYYAQTAHGAERRAARRRLRRFRHRTPQPGPQHPSTTGGDGDDTPTADRTATS